MESTAGFFSWLISGVFSRRSRQAATSQAATQQTRDFGVRGDSRPDAQRTNVSHTEIWLGVSKNRCVSPKMDGENNGKSY